MKPEPTREAEKAAISVLIPRRQDTRTRGKACLPVAFLRLCAFAFLLLPISVLAATNDLTSALQKGLFAEEANHNLEAAAAAYQAVSAQFDKDRKLAATAIFRLGEVYRKQGKTNEAVVQYERIVREFSDQETLATLSRQNLANLGRSLQPSAAPALSPAARLEQRRLLEAEIKLLETKVKSEKLLLESGRADFVSTIATQRDLLALRRQLIALSADAPPEAVRKEQSRLFDEEIGLLEKLFAAQEQQVSNGVAPEGSLVATRRELLALKRQRIALADEPLLASTSEVGATLLTDEEEQEIRRIQAMIQNSPDLINAPSGSAGPRNMTPLCLAASRGQLRVARFLLENGASVEQKAGDGPGFIQAGAPVHHAAAGGHKAMIELLTQYKADLEARDKDGHTPLHIAASKGFQGVAEALVAAKADVNARTKNESTPLHLTAVFGRPHLTAFLVVKGASVNAQDAVGQTSLFIAAVRGYSEVLNRLISAKADPNIVDSSGRSALSYVAGNGHVDMVKALLEAKADPNAGTSGLPLAVVCNREGTNIANLLLRAGADPNRAAPVDFEVSLDGRAFGRGAKFTPLQIAVAKQRADLAIIFFQFKADPQARLPVSGSPLVWETYGNADLLKAFLDAGADPNADGGDATRNLLYMAASVGNADGVKALLAAGARVNAPTDARDTPLHIAVRNGDPKTVRLLLDAGAEVNRFNREGFTPLWRAVRDRKTDMAALLLAHGADPNLALAGSTPLHAAVGQESRSLVQLLLTNKADVNVRDIHGKTPLDYAKEKMAGPRASGAFGVLPLPSSPSRQDPEAQPISAAALADLLRQHGAVDDLPRTDRIEVRRASANYSAVVFGKVTNDWNQFSLLELIAAHYGLTSDRRSGVPQPRTGHIAGLWSREALRFPDFKKLVIHRPAADGRSWTTIPVNVADILSSDDCSRDVMLRWGDVVEIPEADHPVAENWPGLAGPDVDALIKCVSRTVTVAINHTNASLNLSPEFLRGTANGVPTGDGNHIFGGQAKLRSVSFMLRSALDQSKLVRFSSDLTRVKVTRSDTASGQIREWTVDCSDANNAPYLWLRDGDVIEVPEKP
jgi:ankyrin repeat protein